MWILFCCILALLLRIMPVISGVWQPGDLAREPDVLYQLRQIEFMVIHPFNYPWFDPLTNYPAGSVMSWGPVFSLLGSLLALLAGAESREAIIATVSWLPVLMAVFMVPLFSLIGTVVWDKRAGLFAALFIALFPGMIFFRSVYGYVDHHIAETFFTSLFCLGYLAGLKYVEKKGSVRDLLVTGLTAGAGLAISVAIIPTVITFSIIIGLAIIWLALYSRYMRDDQILTRFIALNTAALLPAICSLTLIGVHDSGFSLKVYSIAHIGIYGILIIAPVILLGISYITKSYSYRRYLGLLSIIAGIFILLLIFVPITRGMLFYHLKSFFLVSDIQNTVSELKPWGLRQALLSLLTGWLVCISGAVLCVIRWNREKCLVCMFLLIWGGVLLISTIQHWRFEYYLAAPITVLMAIASSEAYSRVFSTRPEKKEKHVTKGKRENSWRDNGRKAFSRHPEAFIILISMGIFLGWSLFCDLSYHPEALDPDQVEAMTWMKEHTPDPGITPEDSLSERGFRQPDQAYGVLAWWEYGHMITLLSGRIPYANPFQENVYLASQLLTGTDENNVYLFLNQTKGRYVITDTSLVSDLYPTVLTWRPGIQGAEPPYLYQVFTRAENKEILSTLLAPAYYQSLAVRLHLYDGSQTNPAEVIRIRYTPSEDPIPQKNGYKFLGTADSMEKIPWSSIPDDEKQSLTENNEHVVIAQTDFAQPATRIDALVHFRLIHETENQTWSVIPGPDGTPVRTFSSVKIFEVVKGASIAGNGTVELTLRTNTGRKFLYRQESQDGLFVLPYPTDTCAGDICPVGAYRTDSGREIRVKEADIR